MQLFKVLKPFEFDNKQRKIGEEIVCGSREGEELAQKKLVTMADKELDPQNRAHQPLIEEAKARKQAKHEDLQTDRNARDDARDEREAAKDEGKEERMNRFAKLVPEDPDAAEEFSKLPNDKQEAKLKEMEKEAEDQKKAEEDEAKKRDEKDGPNPSRKNDEGQ